MKSRLTVDSPWFPFEICFGNCLDLPVWRRWLSLEPMPTVRGLSMASFGDFGHDAQDSRCRESPQYLKSKY